MRSIRSTALRLHAVLLLALTLCACDTPSLTPLNPGATILAFGDSLTYGTGAPQDDAYPQVLARLTGLRVINAGVPGEVSAEGAERLANLLVEHAPALVVLVHGGNDTLRNLPKTATRANLRSMIEASRRAGAEVVMLGVPGRNFSLSTPAYYGEIAAETDVPIDEDALPALMRDRSMKSDAVHFNASGYAAMADAVASLLRDAGALR
ncbi:MAG: arylesterase [Halieaceae bacterium]|jgi:lysophospholipase L1-like esterase|nr:arylesterase [Halieaceae bacterium]